MFQLIKPNTAIPESLIQVDKKTLNLNIEEKDDGGATPIRGRQMRGLNPTPFDKTIDSSSVPLLLSQASCPNDGNWHSWECDAKWFMDSFCSEGSQKYCSTNIVSAWQRRTGHQMNITGIAAGFDTQARYLIRWKKPGIFSSSWKTHVDSQLSSRTYSHWYFPKHYQRYFEIKPTSGESRVHYAVTFNNNSSSSPPSTAYQEYKFCVSSVYTPKRTIAILATNWTEAENILRSQLGNLGAGDSWTIGQGDCVY